MMSFDLMDWVRHTAKKKKEKPLKIATLYELKSCRQACAYELTSLLSRHQLQPQRKRGASRCRSRQASCDELFDKSPSSSRSSNLFRASGISGN